METATSSPAPGQLKFGSEDAFYQRLRRRVDQYFQTSGARRRDLPRMYLKTAMILGWFAASYGLLVFVTMPWWIAAAVAVSLALSMAAIGFNIQHDGGHQAYSELAWINKLAALTLDLMGGSSYIWDRKHNSIHHTYANITGHDDDINIGFLGRLSPHQKRWNFHRLQHFYLWALYGLLPIKWQVYDDFRDVLIGRVGEHRCRRPRGWDLAAFVGGKLLFFTLAWGVPLCFHSVWAVLGFYVGVTFVQGITLSVVFQLAHCGDESTFPMPCENTGRIQAAWAVHQVQTTANFGRSNRLLTWYVGGLNYQIEHHLFPRICHLHYTKIAPLVEETCQEFGIRYVAHPTFRAALVSHFRWLREMGRPETATTASVTMS